MSDDLVKRLREMRGPNVWEAADRIEQLEARLKEVEAAHLISCKDNVSNMEDIENQEKRIEKLEAALRPFAKWADAYEPDEGDGHLEAWDHAPTIGMLRAARNALEGKND